MDRLFSILIPSWNNLEYLKLCIRSLLQNSTYKHQIIIHVNEGTDGTLDWVKEQGFDYTYSKENIGICLAMNTMRRKVATDYILYVNDDMYALPGWDEVMWKEVQSLPDHLFYLSGSLIEPHSSMNTSITRNYGESLQTFEEERLLKEQTALFKEDWRGATWPPSLVHKDLWDLVGGYSIEFSPGMASDPDFTAKLWMVGVHYLKGLGKCLFYHFVQKSTLRIVKNRGSLQFLIKWGITYSTLRENIARFGEPFQKEEIGKINKKHLRYNLIRSRIKSIFSFAIHGFGISWSVFERKKK